MVGKVPPFAVGSRVRLVGRSVRKVLRVRDREPEGAPLRFTSTILPPYLRKFKSIKELLPWLYLKGISSGDFSDALAVLLGPDAPDLSATPPSPG